MAPRQRIDRRADILAAAAAIMEKGTRPRELTMEAVARAAGIGKCTLYRHFPNREALLQALATEGLIHPPEAAADRREAILQAALRTYASLGLPGATMEAVAQEAGVSPATLYRHFRSKDDLAEALLLRFSVLGDASRLAAPGFAGDDREALYAFILHLLEVAVERAPLIRLVLTSATIHPGAAQEAFRQGPGRIMALLAAYFEHRAQAGAFRRGNAWLRAQALVSACVMFGLAASMAGTVPSIPLEAVAREYTDLFLHGLRKGE